VLIAIRFDVVALFGGLLYPPIFRIRLINIPENKWMQQELETSEMRHIPPFATLAGAFSKDAFVLNQYFNGFRFCL
jgi:hypothetical protein